MFKACGCLVGMVIGFLFAVIVSIFIACVAFEKKPSEIKKICTEYFEKVMDEGVDDAVEKAVDKAADKAYEGLKK